MKLFLVAGLKYPTLDFYKEVILEGTKYIFHKDSDRKCNGLNSTSQKNKSIRIEIDDDNLICAFKGCGRSKNSYKRIFSLINHYKTEHPEAEVYDKEGNRLDNN